MSIAIVLITTVQPIQAQAPEPKIIEVLSLSTKDDMVEFVKSKAQEYNVSSSLMICLINHENRNWEPTLQSGIIKNGVREKSFGLSQIHLPSHPSISLDEATNPIFAIDFMASEINKGRAWQWSTLHYCK